ncbi:hypothetical protein TNCV_4694521 [Trichonephila clavipes]|nr:hypothetical protein TNCV_4694521 [Trichonephila clavipes]
MNEEDFYCNSRLNITHSPPIRNLSSQLRLLAAQIRNLKNLYKKNSDDHPILRKKNVARCLWKGSSNNFCFYSSVHPYNKQLAKRIPKRRVTVSIIRFADDLGRRLIGLLWGGELPKRLLGEVSPLSGCLESQRNHGNVPKTKAHVPLT